MKLAVATIGLALTISPAMAAQFSADMVNANNTSKGAPVHDKIYFANGKFRVEAGGPEGNIVIVDLPANKSYLLVPSQKIYMEMSHGIEMATAMAPADPENPCPQWQKMGQNTATSGQGSSCHREGTDTVGGRSAVKFETESADHSIKSFVWIDQKLNFMIKTADRDGKPNMELENIKEAEQPDDLFVIPADYKKMDAHQH